MIFIDSNVLMYLIGADHPHKTDSQVILERLIAGRQRLVTDAGVFEEILHRFCALQRRDAIDAAYEVLLNIVDDVLPVLPGNVYRAREILHASTLGARDALHIAVMEAHGITNILSFDSDFDRWPGLTRLHRV